VLTLHIGLPKTGTTFLQHRIFRRVPDLRVVHRSIGPQEDKLCASLRTYVGASGLKAGFMRRALTTAAFGRLETLDGALPPGGILLSDENLSIQSGGFWRNKGPDPEKVAERLHALVAPMPPHLGPVKVLIGLRSQDTWLASRYAESARHMDGFSQANFEARVMRIAQTGTLTGPLAWLDHARVYRAFAGRFGADYVVLLRQEQLEARPGRVLQALGQQLGGLDLARIHRRLKRRKVDTERNKLKVADTTWLMRGTDTPLELRDEIRTAILTRFAASNETLAALGNVVTGPQHRRQKRKARRRQPTEAIA
jgi:hypothetical protein